MNKNILYLASQSKSRQKLLKDANIPYKLIEQSADETVCDWTLPLKQLVEDIAVHKMNHIILPKNAKENEISYVLTADTLGINFEGKICGKPSDKNDAIQKIKSYRKGAQTGTAFCLDKKIFKNGKWEIQERILKFASAKYIFDVPDDWIEKYFELSINAGISYMQLSGAVAIEEFGAQFLKNINGSYTAVVGLPMFELRESLSENGFF